MLAPACAAAVADPAVDDSFDTQLAQLINRYRAQQGLATLAPDHGLQALAAEHSRQMAERRQASHDDFAERFRRAGSTGCVENVAWNYPTAEALLEGWQRSATHRRNLLDPAVSRLGVVADARYVTFFACR